ncbi:MAG: hypothetical protein JXR51_01605 [Bacteroidales bacterium]|nr:hypothetical protein [Bacteroidales bacterium]
MRNLLIVIFISFFLISAKSQDQSDICKKMGKVKVVFTNKLNKDSLIEIKKKMLKKGIKLDYIKYSFDKEGGLKYIDLKVKCIGCGTGGSMSIRKREGFKKGVPPWGFYFNHGHSPSFKIGEVADM